VVGYIVNKMQSCVLLWFKSDSLIGKFTIVKILLPAFQKKIEIQKIDESRMTKPYTEFGPKSIKQHKKLNFFIFSI
jgi:hypothetical protein